MYEHQKIPQKNWWCWLIIPKCQARSSEFKKTKEKNKDSFIYSFIYFEIWHVWRLREHVPRNFKFFIVKCVSANFLINGCVAIMTNELVFFKSALLNPIREHAPKILTFLVHFFQVSVLDSRVKAQCIQIGS